MEINNYFFIYATQQDVQDKKIYYNHVHKKLSAGKLTTHTICVIFTSNKNSSHLIVLLSHYSFTTVHM